MEKDSKISIEKTEKNTKKPWRVPSVKYIGVIAFFMALYLGMFAGFIPALRPKYSESEKRALASFPNFTSEKLFSGDYFDAINLWFSDTFPAREEFMKLNDSFRWNNIGGDVRIYGETEEIADEIPDQPPKHTEEDKPTVEDEFTPQPFKNVTGENVETVGMLLVVGDTAYELYNFRKDCADKYCGVVNRLAKQLEGTSTVYSMVIPTGIGVMVSDELLKKYNVNSSDQHKAINYLYGGMSPLVKTVDVYPYLAAHRSEYLYFRTDHHWTADAAYYGYTALMKAAGRTPFELNHYTKVVYKGFLGTFYTKSTMDKGLKKNPDTVCGYKPQDVVTFDSTYRSNGKVYKKTSPLVQNADQFTPVNKYLMFMGGDRVLDVIRNPKVHDGSVCTVVKDSYSNCLIPFMVDQYQTVYVVDSREYTKVYQKKLADFVRETGSTEVFVIHNISATRSPGFINGLIELIGS